MGEWPEVQVMVLAECSREGGAVRKLGRLES